MSFSPAGVTSGQFLYRAINSCSSRSNIIDATPSFWISYRQEITGTMITSEFLIFTTRLLTLLTVKIVSASWMSRTLSPGVNLLVDMVINSQVPCFRSITLTWSGKQLLKRQNTTKNSLFQAAAVTNWRVCNPLKTIQRMLKSEIVRLRFNPPGGRLLFRLTRWKIRNQLKK